MMYAQRDSTFMPLISTLHANPTVTFQALGESCGLSQLLRQDFKHGFAIIIRTCFLKDLLVSMLCVVWLVVVRYIPSYRW